MLRFKVSKPKKWSSSWKSSEKARKQIKYRANAPLHIKRKFLNVHLAKPLREKYNIRSIEIRKGDKVKIMRGEFKGKTAEVERVDLVHTKVYLKNIKRKKQDGTEISIAFDPSNLMITDLNLDDKKRIEKESKKENTENKKEKKSNKKTKEE
ncbi:MAG: 50S ribosomal protein L24 [Candidatus Woesearchaeota archaeon]